MNPRVVRTMAWLGLALLVVISGLSFWSSRTYQKSATWREHSALILDYMAGAQLDLATAESAQRGFLLTGQEIFLKNYSETKDSANRTLDLVQSQVKDNPVQADLLDRIRPLVTGKFEFLDHVIAMYRAKQTNRALQAVQEGEGRVIMDAINELIIKFEKNEMELLKLRSQQADRDFNRIGYLVIVGLATAFVLLLTVKTYLRKEIIARAAVNAELVIAEAKATEASELKTSFLANMSHEIRTPLNGIVGMAKLLENTGLTPEQRDFLDTMKVSSNSLLSLINQILDFSKIESGKMQLEEAPFELYSLIQSTSSIVEYAATSKNLRLITNIAPDVPEFYLGDALRLRQVILNLLNNAIKFSEKGSVQLNVTRLKAWESRANLNFEIIDEGVGMNADTKTKLFQTFTQGDESTSRKFGGSGLGLAISKQIVEMMDGRIGADSQPGKGSRFFFDVVLKVSKYRAEDRSIEANTDLKQRKLGAHILIAEDNKVNQKVVAEMMKMLGCSVKMVVNGVGVLEILKSEKFDLILMDGQMPEMDGYEATRRIRNGEGGEDAVSIPIVATTANAIKGDIEKCLEAGMNDYIGKPISYDDLAYKVEKWLRRGKLLIDAESIERLITLGNTSGADLVPGLIELFEQESVSAIVKMREHIEAGNFEGAATLAHSLKSSSANLGALRLRDLCERVEKSKVDPNARHLAIVIQAAQRECEGAIKELKEKWLRA